VVIVDDAEFTADRERIAEPAFRMEQQGTAWRSGSSYSGRYEPHRIMVIARSVSHSRHLVDVLRCPILTQSGSQATCFVATKGPAFKAEALAPRG